MSVENQVKSSIKNISSPCVNNCCLNPENLCVGCLRHIDEILRWGNASNDEKRNILQQVEERKRKITQ